MTYAGIDLHKKFAYIALMDEKGEVILQNKVSADPEETTKFFKQLADQEIKAVMEPISSWYYYYEVLEKLGYEVHLANPLKVKAIASAKIKTDKIDATVLAHLLRTNLLPEAYIPSRKTREFKELLRHRASLVRLRTQVKNKIHAILHKNGFINQFSDLFGASGIEYLKDLKLRKIYREKLDNYLLLIDTFNDLVDWASERIQMEVKEDALASLLTTIPGISYFSALLIKTEIGEISRFPDYSHLASYAGIVPSVYASGGKMRTGRITKQGSRWLRWILVEAAQKQGRYESKLGLYYQRLKKRKGTKAAKLATARKLTQIIYLMLSKGVAYQRFPAVSSGHSSPSYSS